MRISLNENDWRFRPFLNGAWLHEHAVAPNTSAAGWQCGTVPGSVQHDLWQCGDIPDPYRERNSLLIEWVPERTWVYRKTFPMNEEHRGKRICLRFEGVDYEAQFFLNGTVLGAHCSMFTPATFDISDVLLWDEPNVIAVVLLPAPREQSQMGRTSLVRTHKTRMNYGWDFCPRMVHLGIWDDVHLDITGPVCIEDVWVRPQLHDDLVKADVAVETTLDAVHAVTAVIDTTIHYEGQIIASECTEHTLQAGRNTITAQFQLADPHLWWPNGAGEQALYEATVRVINSPTPAPAPNLGEGWRSRGGGDYPHTPSDERTINFGIRHVELITNETPDESAPPYTFVINGVKLYITGWNWLPIDMLYGLERPQKLERLLTLAQRAHVNLLRVNGVGLIEKQQFYELCDRIGIMVWQEFILSSSVLDRKPTEERKYIDMLVGEARQIVPRKRNHPSLVVWGGGNELESLELRPLDDDEPVIGALRDVVAELDSGRLWLPTSARGRKPFNCIPSINKDPHGLHDVHGPWHYEGLTEQYMLYNAGTSLFHSEFGGEGLTNEQTIGAIMPPVQQWPVMLASSVWQHLGTWWVRPSQWQHYFGPINDLSTLVRATQFLQAEGVRYVIESNRRRMYQNSGSLPWQFNEPYPMAASTSAVDYFARPKALYHAVARAYEPLQVSAKFATLAWAERAAFEAEVWIVNGHERTHMHALLKARIVGTSGTVYATGQHTLDVAANRSTCVAPITCALDHVQDQIFLLDLILRDADGASLATNRYLFTRTANLAPMLQVPATTLDVHTQIAADDWELTITNMGAHVVLAVALRDGRDVHAGGYVYFDDNHFCLLPGEQRTVLVDWHDVAPHDRCLSLRAWNVDPLHITNEGNSGSAAEPEPMITNRHL